MPFAGLPTPAPDLLRANRPASRNLCHRHARPKRLSDNPPLLLIRPPSSTARPRQNLDPPKPRLRVVVNYVHSDRSMPKLRIDPAQIIPSQEEGPRRPAYLPPKPPPCCSGHCLHPGRSPCAKSTVGRASESHPPQCLLISSPDLVTLPKPETPPQAISTQSETPPWAE